MKKCRSGGVYLSVRERSLAVVDVRMVPITLGLLERSNFSFAMSSRAYYVPPSSYRKIL